MRPPIRITAVVAGLLIALAVGIVMMAGSGDAGSRRVVGVFESANGLIKGGQVRAGGLKIGSVTDVTLGDDGYPHVTMKVSGDYQVRRGATGDLRLASQAGQLNRFIDIKNGTGERLPDGATLGLARTDEPIEIDDVLSTFTPKVRGEVRTLVARAARTIDGRGPDVARTLRHSGQALNQVADLLGDVTADRAALRTLVARAADATSQLAAQPADTEAVIDLTARLLDVAAGRQAEVGATLDALPAALHAPRATLARFRRDVPTLRGTVRRLSTATQPLEALARELARTARASPATFAQARALVAAFLKDGRTLQSLLHAAGPIVTDGTPAAKGLNPILDQFRSRVADTLGWLPLLGDASSNYDAVGHGVRVIGLLPEPPRRLTSSSADCTGGLLRRPFDRVPGALECDAWTGYLKSFIGGGLNPLTQVTPQDTASRDSDLK